MKNLLLAGLVSFAFVTPASASQFCEDVQIGHALKTYEDRCGGNLTSAGQSLKNGGGFCNSVLEVSFQHMTDSSDFSGDTDLGDDDDAAVKQICAAAEDMIVKYGTDNDTLLAAGLSGE